MGSKILTAQREKRVRMKINSFPLSLTTSNLLLKVHYQLLGYSFRDNLDLKSTLRIKV